MSRICQPTPIAPLLVLALRRYGIELTEEELRALGDEPPRPQSRPMVPIVSGLPIESLQLR